MMLKQLKNWGIATVVIFVVRIASAQPLVEGNLTLYYDFDEIILENDEKTFIDSSGNGFNATIYEGDPDVDLEPGALLLDTANARRGSGAALFKQSPNAEDLPVYADVHGERITSDFPDLLPDTGFNDQFGLTIAAWLNVTANDGGDQSVFQGRTGSGGHGAPHFQLQGNGQFRMTLRDQGGGNVADGRGYADGASTAGEPYPVDEWFHYAATFDSFEGFWAMYYNGEVIAEGVPQNTNALGDWGGQTGENGTDFFAAGFGAVYDSGGRRLDGLMDELYVFNRALTEEEIQLLVNIPEPSLIGDCNGDGVRNQEDLGCISNLDERDAVLATLNTLPGDLDGNGDVAFDDFVALSNNFGSTENTSYSNGDIDLSGAVDFDDFVALSNSFGQTPAAAASVPEPTTSTLLAAACMTLGLFRRRSWSVGADGFCKQQ